MHIPVRLLIVVAFLLCFASVPTSVSTAPSNNARVLSGLWEAKRYFGPDVRGRLIIKQTKEAWWAEIAGNTIRAIVSKDAISFKLADGVNSFQGKFNSRRTTIVGHWSQPGTVEGGPYASPVTLTRNERGVWQGYVSPLEAAITLYLMIRPNLDGTAGAFLKNPERNIGLRQYPVAFIELDGESVKLIAKDKGTEKTRVIADGRYDVESEILSIYLPNRGGTFDFRRVRENEPSNFYPRGRPTARYFYEPPTAMDDGWSTASLEDVGISRTGIEAFIQMLVDTPIDSAHSPEVHGVLIARHGKLVLEEYFHGENRDKPHDTRSASKSLTATLIGAAMNDGVPIKLSSPVYQVMNGGTFPADLEPRKRALTLETLLTMSSGLDCDDSDQNSPGREDYMVDESGATDFYKYILALKMIREPGEKAVYCSINPHLAGGVLKLASGRSLLDLMQDLIADPLQIKRYYIVLTPTGDAYMGGGARFLPRDFMKLGQLHLNGGVWNGRRILTSEWCLRATSPLTSFSESSKARYGYQWWMLDYAYKGKTVRGYFASGNGWQHVIVIPELDLVIAFYAGNYSDDLPLHRDYVPNWILPALVKF